MNFGVDDAVRFDADEGTHLAESLASALGDVVGAGVDVVGGVVFEVDFNLLTGSFEFIHEGFTDFKGTVCDASCTAADDDSAGDFSGFRFVIADAFFDVGGSEFCHYATSLDSFACLASSSSMTMTGARPQAPRQLTVSTVNIMSSVLSRSGVMLSFS